MDRMRHALALPDGCPPATAGVVLPGGREAVIGLFNGDAYKWDMRDGSYEKVFMGCSRISAIDMLEGMLLVSARDGPLFTMDAESHRTETLRRWWQSKSSRIWKCAWLGGGRAVMTSTCGGIHVYERGDGGAWEYSSLHGHVHSVLAVGVHGGELLATGDRTGRIVVWERRNGSYCASAGMRGMSGAVGALAWVDGRTLVGIDENGIMRQFEKDPTSDRWEARCELDVAVGGGTSLHLADDKKTLLAGTEAEVVQVDLETMRYKAFPLGGAVGIGSEGDTAYIVAGDGVHTLPIGAIEEPPGAVEYRQIRVSLVGRAGVGKSTLCSAMARAAGGQAKAGAIGPTLGRRVWQMKIGDGGAEGAHRIMLHDHVGEGSVLPAFLQASEDSDVVLALFKQTDRSTLDAACESLKSLRTARYNGMPRRFLVATHADGGLGEVTDGDLRRAAEDGGADGFLRIDARTAEGAGAVKDLFYDARLWDGAGRVVKSELILAVEAALDHWKGAGDRPVLSLGDIRSASEGLARTAIPEAHLDSLLRGMDRRGLLTYYGEIGQVVLDDADHDRVRSGIPMLAGRSNGIVEKDRIGQEYGASRYTEPILSALRASGAFVKCRDRMVFPHLLRDGPVDVPDWFSERLQNPMLAETLAFGAESVDAAELISAAASLNLPCVDATRTGALFASKGGAGLYYDISPADDPIEGPHTLIAYRVGGTRRVFCEALADEFATLARRIAGPRMVQRIKAPAASAQ